MYCKMLLIASIFVNVNAMLELPQEMRELIFLHLIESARELSELKLICCVAQVNKMIYKDYQADIIKNKIEKVKKKLIKREKYFQDYWKDPRSSIRPVFQSFIPEKITWFREKLNPNDPELDPLNNIKN